MAIASSSAISKTEYEVFLSFRGPDTRQSFTDVLYDHLRESGIQVFRDDDELAIGDRIELILDAINNSKICVPIFSKSFASSAWCLREVAKMVELNKDIVPIFYDVTPDDVKLKTSLYVDQMKEHQQGKAQLVVEEWEKALLQVGRIKGRALKDIGFVEFCKKFRAEILLKLRVNQKYIIKHLVEMPDVVEEALMLLEMESVDVRFLGLYGMGGVGKTTLAKIIFNQISGSFDSCSFLANIREERSSKGVEYLQKKLLQDLNPKAVSNNMNFHMKSILIVLDDVGERRHIDELVGDSILFGSRSRIIITTRDERVLLMNVAEASSSGEGRAKMSACITKVHVKGMTPEQALQLFSRHAFGRDYPLEDYTNLSKDAISICGGLPLALEVIGSLLYGTSMEEWEEKVTNLKMIPAEDVQQKLMISYNALEDNVKEIFLDIACFFIGEEKSNPIYMWKACGYAPTWSIRILVAMSLVKVTDDGRFWMHDQLIDLGREVVRIEGYNGLTSRKGSRIHTYEDALSVHERNKENEVVGLRLHGNDDRLTDFVNFKSLRFLQVTSYATAFHHRNFWRLSTNLIWLSLRLNKPDLTAPIKSMFSVFCRNRDSPYLMNLAVLCLSRSDITDSWEGWILIQELRRLKVLDLSECRKLTRTLNFSKMEALEKLIFYWCSRLAKIDTSIGKLRKLKYLNLEYCYILKELPEEIGNLEDLEQIMMKWTNISKLPDSIGKLKNLERMDLSTKKLKKLPESIGELRSLVHLNIAASRLKELPPTVGMLAKLKHLTLSLPDLVKLPESIGDLTSLVNLDLSGCFLLEELPSSITRLKKLERLILRWCFRLVKLPDDLGNLELLVELNLSKSCVSVLPETVAHLSLLKKLDISGSDGNERVSELPTSLTDLKLNVCSLIQAPDLSKLSQLRKLSLRDDRPGVDEIELSVQEPFFKFGAIRLEVLELELWRHTSLPVEFSALTQLKSLTLRGIQLTRIPPFPSSLQSLTLSFLGKETELPCFSNLNNLSEFVFKFSSMEVLPDLSRLKHLKALGLLFCKELIDIPGFSSLVSLIRLEVKGCESLKRLEDIQYLTSLRDVSITKCKNFTGIQSIDALLHVSRVEISRCKCRDIMRYN